ncbi:MAG: hypothetical protein ACSLFB_12405 [Acidimicrobiales bacterium]
MTQYRLSVWHDGEYPTREPEIMDQMSAQVGAFNDDLQASRVWGP